MNQLINAFRDRKNEFYQWILHNLFFGLAGVWIPYLLLGLLGQFRQPNELTYQSLLMFSVTSCAISMGFFVKETQTKLKATHALTHILLMVTMLIGVLALSSVILVGGFKEVQPPIALCMPFISWLTYTVVAFAICLNFRLFMVEQDIPKFPKIESQLNEDVDHLTQQAKEQNEASGVIL